MNKNKEIALTVAVIMVVLFVLLGIRSCQKMRTDRQLSTDSLVQDTLIEGRMPASQGTHHCLSVEQMIYISQMVKVRNGRVRGVKSEEKLDGLMASLGYKKINYHFIDNDGDVLGYAYGCTLDETGSITDAKTKDANRVLVACDAQPEGSKLVSMTVLGRSAYDELLMQINGMNYYKADDAAFHKEGSQYKIFPAELLDNNGFEIDICRDIK